MLGDLQVPYMLDVIAVRLCREKKSGTIFAMKKLKKSEMLSRGQDLDWCQGGVAGWYSSYNATRPEIDDEDDGRLSLIMRGRPIYRRLLRWSLPDPMGGGVLTETTPEDIPKG
ncbi:AGC (cAMP-dependent, cGMP-dependent and protein kinase C) kinase family protein [Actinidia rufa]|uniref:AGC (cAMP-dependent, cGMP-dependent and protein kinase C) kinase family protein n=1 Tax=Actinidia rufa TaxID=165716 RepID=A0A7J0DX61_9ERIC|nr:AGC (cAMP-dependent, cGMP-dependent and protein kinase C) kinase family protein [Actinidia rufa]